MIPHLKLAELLCTRLCHDLTGPIGAIANGTEFLNGEDGAKMQDMAVELINSSAAQAVARLQFYRRAYGRINDEGEANLDSLRKIVNDFFVGGKITLDWPDAHTHASGVAISYKMSRLLINLLIIASAALLRGGTIAIRLEPENNMKMVKLIATGKSVKWDPEIETMLTETAHLDALTPKVIQAYMTRLLAKEIDATLTWKVTEESLEIIACQKI